MENSLKEWRFKPSFEDEPEKRDPRLPVDRTEEERGGDYPNFIF